MEIEIRVRRAWWKKPPVWLFLAAACAALFAWHKRAKLESRAIALYREQMLPRLPALRFLARKTYRLSRELGREVLPEKVEAPPLPAQPPANTLSAPEASPKTGLTLETSLTWVQQGQMRGKPKMRAGPRAPGNPEEARDLQRLKTKIPAGSSIPLNQDQRPSMEGPRLGDELPFYRTLTGGGVLLFLGIAAFFGLFAYVMLGVRKK